MVRSEGKGSSLFSLYLDLDDSFGQYIDTQVQYRRTHFEPMRALVLQLGCFVATSSLSSRSLSASPALI